MTQQQGSQLEPQRVIDRLRQQLADAQMQAAQYGALADQLAEENAELRKQQANDRITRELKDEV